MLTKSQPLVPHTTAFDCPVCGQKCRNNSGLTCHKRSKHPRILVSLESKEYTCISHLHLTGSFFFSLFWEIWYFWQFSNYLAQACAPDGTFLREPILEPTPAALINATSDNCWAPFTDRLAFDWAYYHYMWLQSSADDINMGLDLWSATVIKHRSKHESSEGVPWGSASKLYETIDSILAGNVTWKTFYLHYTGLKPQPAPQ